MSKLHEALAVEGSLKGVEAKIISEAEKSFTSKSHLYTGHTKKYSPLDDDDKEVLDGEIKNLVDNVPSKLKYVQESIVEAMDCMYQKESTNTEAKADIEIDGIALAVDVPVVVLLNLENKLKSYRKVVDCAPTLDPSQTWTKDENEDNVYVTGETKTQRTKKSEVPIVLYEATDKHPAQTKLITKDVHVGNWTHTYKSGCLSPRDKHDRLKRIDDLIKCIVKARTKANDTELKKINIGKKLFDYING